MHAVLENHKVSCLKQKQSIEAILTKYNSKKKSTLTPWRQMNMVHVCTIDQKVLIGWLTRMGDPNIPIDTGMITNRLVADIRLKGYPYLV